MTFRSLSIAIAAVSVVALSATADADNRKKAESLFRQGKKLMADKRYADACEAFEKSQKLDPAIGTLLNVARCYEEWGKIGRAYLAYQAAEKMAKDANDDRAPKIREHVERVEPDVPRLTIIVPSDAPPDLEVTLDSRKVDTLNQPFVVDPGPHTIEWRLPGGEKRAKIVPIDRGGDSEITLTMPVPGGPDDPGAVTGVEPVRKPEEPTERSGQAQRVLGIAVAGAGALAMGMSSYLTLTARSDYNRALDKYCGGMKNNCDMTGLEITHNARSTANTATIVFVAGAALVAGGAVVYFLAPDKPAKAKESARQSLYLTPSVSPEGVGVVLGGTL